MKQAKFVRTRRYLLIAFAVALTLSILLLMPSVQDTPTVADALVATNTVLPDNVKCIFKDYSLTTLADEYNSLDKINELRNSTESKYQSYLDRAEQIIRGDVRFNGMREFSTKQDALNHIDQYGDLAQIQTGTLKWSWTGSVAQVTGIYGISNEQFTVYVEASDGANIPYLDFAQSKGDGHTGLSWRDSVALRNGINTFNFPFGYNSKGDKSGVVYIRNPYTENNQGGDVKIYIEGGGFYPVYRVGDDENAFVEQLKEFDRQRNANTRIPDIAELLPDYALLTIRASIAYDAYVNNNVSPAKNIELWNNYFTETFRFHGMSLDDPEHPVQPDVRLNIRYMNAMPGAGAYTFYYHIGVYSNEDKWFVDYNNNTLSDYQRFAHVGHEIGHTLDTNGRTVVETTNNMNAVNAYFMILGNSMTSIYLPFNKAQQHIFSDYSLDYQAYDDGHIVYTGSNYDHNYMMWWYLECLFPGYWARLNNYYRYDNTANYMSYDEKMVYYSSLATQVDLSDYFERWGWYYARYQSGATKFTYNGSSQAFKNAMENAKNNGSIEKVYDHYWYVDIKQMDFTLNHPNATEDQRAYSGGAPNIVNLKMDGSYRVLEISGNPDSNLLGYEVYSSIDGEHYKVAGFTYTSKFTDKNTYNSEPFYKVRGINRYFSESEDSNVVHGPTAEPTGDVCRVGEQYYTDLKEAFNTVSKTGGVINLLANCEISSSFQLSGTVTVTFQVDSGVTSDITITNKSAYSFVNLLSPNANIVFKGNADANIILDGGNANHVFAAFDAQSGSITAEYLVVSNYNSTASLNGLLLSAGNAIANFTNCRFENSSSSYSPLGAVAGGTSTTFENCVFEGITTANPSKYSGAIGLNKSGSGAIVLDNCQFINNDVADIYLNGDFTFKTNVPEVVVDFVDGYNTINLSNCFNAEEEVRKITLNNVGYRAELDNDTIKIVAITFQLTFQSSGSSKTYTLSGTDVFTFGEEKFELDEDWYIDKYVGNNNVEYHIGDTITVTKNLTFRVELKQYLSLTLKYGNGAVVKEKVVKIKQQGKFYLPRFDDNGKEIVKWVSGGATYWAGNSYIVQGNDTLIAIYPAMFSYTFVCRGQVVKYGYASYNDVLDLDLLGLDLDNLIFWRVGTQTIAPNGTYTITSDVVFVGVYSDDGDTFYNLSNSEITVEQAGFQYDGQAQTPSITVTIDGQFVPEKFYKVTYGNNINAGVATITIVSNGYYSFGSRTVSFDILPVTYSQDDFSIDNVVYEIIYSGNQTAQHPVITWNSTTLVANKDYTIGYSDNRVKVGTVNVTIMFQGNFNGQATFDYEIVRADRNSFKVAINGWTFGKTASSPSVSGYGEWGTVTYTYATTQDGNYDTVKPQDAGNYWVKAEIVQTDNYNGAVAYAQFTITKATLTTVPTNFTVDSRKTTLQDVANKLPTDWHWAEQSLKLNIGANKAEAVYKDELNYVNSRVQVTITVTEFIASVAQAKVTVEGNFTYNGNPHTPAVKVELNGEVLQERTDYTLAYANNTQAGTGTVTVTGVGEYQDSKQVTFIILPQDVSDLIEIEVADAVLTDGVYKIVHDGQPHAITATVRELDGVAVTVDTSSVTNTGKYRVKATVTSDNYCGEREITVHVYSDAVEPAQDDNTVAIAVGVGSGVVGIGTIGGAIFWFIRRRKRK